MKDRQPPRSTVSARIPVISDALHCVSMSVLVFLRSSFGFSFLRPRSFFFAVTWAFLLFSIYAYVEREPWRHYGAFCIFGLGAIFLYWLHFALAAFREAGKKGEHDYYSGTSHGIAILRKLGVSPSERGEMHLHLWGEPCLILFIALVSRVAVGGNPLSTWLIFSAICLSLKESINYWHRLRREKLQMDAFADAEDMVKPHSPTEQSELPKATRKERVIRARNTVDDSNEHRFAKLLNLSPPYSIEQAEESYRRLIKLDHPDTNDNSVESTLRSGELNEAIEYFRRQ